ncbi:MAG: MBL fold metallo-hydrolase [Actinobacteria bacterium]|nr:MBL fold metallo-hydrolase [Actinomycetota bacterium]
MIEPSGQPIDLHHQGAQGVIGVYRLETDDGSALFDCGPATCFDRLREQVDVGELRHLLLSHIHLDHAGAAGLLVRENPQIQVHVSEIGLPHVVDPSRLIASARRLYGDTLDTLFGEPTPVPAENVHVAGHREIGLVSFPTPGHASHHVCYLDEEGTLYAGDACGVRLLPARHVLPHAPPPDVDLDAWERTFDDILKHQPERLALIHFGVVEDLEQVAEHVGRARDYLRVWSGRVKRGMTEDEFIGAARHDYEGAEGACDERLPLVAPFEQSYAGLARYWRKRHEVA